MQPTNSHSEDEELQITDKNEVMIKRINLTACSIVIVSMLCTESQPYQTFVDSSLTIWNELKYISRLRHLLFFGIFNSSVPHSILMFI